MGNAALACCAYGKPITKEEDINVVATNRVELAVSELFGFAGLAQAFHTSVLVNGEEFFFSDSGIISDRSLASHQGEPSERVELGYSNRSGAQLLCTLTPYFRTGTYDLLRKNCNSFSDCASYFLTKRRLERRYSAMERLGRANVEFVQQVTKGMYTPNPEAVSFDVEKVIAELDEIVVPSVKDTASEAIRKCAFYPGVQVTIVGLKSAQELNGQGAVIVRYNAGNGRWEAKVNSTGEIKALRAENVRPAGEVALRPGDVVEVHGLQSETGQAMNGKKAEVLRYLFQTSRYEVRVNGELKALKASNLRVVSE